MARQLAPIAGAVVGTFFGNPQLGFAIGSILGNIIDPQKIRAPGLKELPVLGVTEGAHRQVAYGTTVIRDCQLMDWGDLDVVEVEERQGKGGPVVVSERLYQTYAVGIGEPCEAIRYIKRNGVMVYDVRPGSTILAESAEFAERFRFYPGSETQLPDPDLEALPRNGVGNTPAYRGTAYFVMVRDDLTDSRGQIPTYEVEVVRTLGDQTPEVSLLTDASYYTGPRNALAVSAAAVGWVSGTDQVRMTQDGAYAAGVDRDGGVATFEWRKFNATTGGWDLLSTPGSMPTGFINSLAWSPDGRYLAMGITTAPYVVVFRRTGSTLTRLTDTAVPPPIQASLGLSWDSVGSRLAATVSASDTSLYVWDFTGEQLVNRKALAGAGTNFIGGAAERIDFLPGAGSRYIAGGNPSYTFVVACTETPMPVVCSLLCTADAGAYWDASGGYLVACGDGELKVLDFDGSVVGAESLSLVSTLTTGIPDQLNDAAIATTRDYLALARESSQSVPTIVSIAGTPPTLTVLTDPPTSAGVIQSVSWSAADLTLIDANSVLLSDIVADICDRCGIPAGKLDLSALTDQVKGVTLGGSYDGAGAITTLMPAFLFDLYSADRELRAVKRGAAVKATITVDDLLDEPDENTLRGQGIEYPRVLQLKYLNPGQDYAAPATTVTNKTTSARVRGEVQIDLPVAFDETEALNVATRMLKVMWEDVNGEAVFSLPSGPFAWLTPTDCLGLVLRGATYRIRAEKVEQTGGQLKVTARRDRQSATTSNLTAIPLPTPAPPPPSLAGVTTFVPMNIPGRVDADDQLGFVFGMTGLPGTAWQGANIAYRIAGGTDWTSLGNFTTRAVMGNMLAPLSAASEFYTDTTNVVQVALVGDDQLEDITEAQFLSEGNPAAIVYPDGTAELIQFRDVQDDGNRSWSLSRLQRGRLATVAGPHSAAANFVMLAGTQFVPLPSALIGQALQFRVTSIGTSPETAPIYDFTWNPVHSQLEFAPVYLSLGRGSGVITASWSPRHRFGTDANPVASVNFTGYRVTATDGATTTSTESVFAEISIADVFTGPVTVSVQQINRFTGPGPAISEVIA